jgi:transposase
MAELGIVAAVGMASITKLAAHIRDDSDERIPAAARLALIELTEQIEMLTARIERLDREIIATVKQDADARRLTSIPGVGPLNAATVRAAVPDPSGFRTGRDFAAWIGLTPRAHSSGGKERLGSISKRGNRQLRMLLIIGATSVLKRARRGLRLPRWIEAIMLRRPFKVVAVALANKIARIIWALLVKGGTCQAPLAIAKA